jgi:regulatory protein
MNGRNRPRATSAGRRSEQEGAVDFSPATRIPDSLPAGAITAIKKARQGAVLIEVDGAPWLAISRATVLAAGLRTGLHVDAGIARDLLAREARHRALEAALHLLAHRPRSEAELRERLGDRGLPADAIEHAIARLKAARLLDDAAFARSWVESRGASRGRRLLAAELRAQGVDEDIAADALAEMDDTQQARKLARRQAERLGPLPWRDFQRRLGGYLARRGFSYGTIAPLLLELWHERCTIESSDHESFVDDDIL